MSPSFRRALHQCVDILCDALVDEEAEEQPRKRRRGPATPKSLPLPDLDPAKLAALEAQLDRQLAKAGYKKTA